MPLPWLSTVGLNCHSGEQNVRYAVKAATAAGYRTVVYHHKGTFGVPITTPEVRIISGGFCFCGGFCVESQEQSLYNSAGGLSRVCHAQRPTSADPHPCRGKRNPDECSFLLGVDLSGYATLQGCRYPESPWQGQR